MIRICKLLLVSIAGLVAANAAWAQDQSDAHPYLTEKFFLDVGIFFPDREVELSVDGPLSSVSDEIDFDTELGLRKKEDLFSLNFGWRFGEKWTLGAQYFESDGRAQKALEEDVVWDDVTFGAGTGVAAGLDFSVVRTFFSRRFRTGDNHQFDLGLGLHWLEIGAFIEGNAIINGAQAGFRRESVSAKAPLPNIGASYIYSFSPKWAFNTRIDWLSAKVGDYDGTLINASVGINFAMFEHVGFGVNYNLFKLDIGVDKDEWRGEVTTTYDGFFVHLTAYW